MDTRYAQRDHEIIHYWADNLESASTKHPLVLNDMYGSDHTVGFHRPLLTKEEIKMMHDNLVEEQGNLETHETPIDFDSSETTKKKNRWGTVLISGPGGKLTKQDVFRYYSDPNVGKQIMEQLRDRPTVMRQTMDEEKTFLRRPEINKYNRDAFDKEDYQYHVERRATEFHPTFKKQDDRIAIDIDPGDNVPFEKTKAIAGDVEDILQNQSFIQNTEVQFSGHRGFYVWGYFPSKRDIDDVREQMKKIFSRFSELHKTPVTIKQRTNANQVRIDLSPLKELGSVKAEGSLDQRTGYISVKIPRQRLYDFDPDRDATVNRDTLRPQYSYKNERVV